jgi:hypothetical protein
MAKKSDSNNIVPLDDNIICRFKKLRFTDEIYIKLTKEN